MGKWQRCYALDWLLFRLVYIIGGVMFVGLLRNAALSPRYQYIQSPMPSVNY
jgi:hypothetical protein